MAFQILSEAILTPAFSEMCSYTCFGFKVFCLLRSTWFQIVSHPVESFYVLYIHTICSQKEWLDYVNLGQDYTIQTPIKMELNTLLLLLLLNSVLLKWTYVGKICKIFLMALPPLQNLYMYSGMYCVNENKHFIQCPYTILTFFISRTSFSRSCDNTQRSQHPTP